MYLIVVGAGDIGTPLVELATAGGNEVVVIERDEERAERASRQYDCLVINDDATSKETLQDAGSDRADALISTTDQDAANIMVCLLAQELSIPNVVSVVHNPEHMSVFEQIGVNTMQNPQSLIAEYLYRAVSRPSIVDFMHIGEEAEVFEITVGPDAPIANMTLREADEADLLGGQTLIVAIERNGEGEPITPRGNTRIEPGDLLTVYSGIGAVPDVTDVFGHAEDAD
ncbi:potassium transporter Trk [Halorubrum salipaludis]|uniref:Potassium transporter Trk n=1 Tax=Halorubrum salipaludis TaxID=2032630 RepID=A0A2A2FJA5_9EURY|nr:TrkA family potassium uptake protein [Halorubrum salipaludis]PAU84757.1 potassium transporter Trk [Halorubrum salipaludis]